ncbi:hypothetical protein [Methylobacterium organophilum]|uniref:Uncharacterized protein n=1 Tax=Methylobacterium organophilum TaxID=410 RepID=A0ABQ4TE35_METOR|nr:hypothetical protein [Methylobacterium organophilum]GJE29548.1 hypothetical protein LKMONMHP_4430 [Methylobacterium organophilum]
MSSTRTLSWNAALRDMRRDPAADAAARRVHLRREAFANAAFQSIRRDRAQRPLVVAGKFDRSAIMAAAVRIAKLNQSVTGATWAAAMASALKGAWKAAKEARLLSAH